MPEAPYGAVEFFAVFRAYHESFPFAPVAWTVLALASVLLIHRRAAGSNRFASAILAGLWIWAGLAYHVIHFAEINPIARVFGVLFVMQGVLIAGLGVLGNRLEFAISTSPAGLAGAALITYALLLYPVIGLLSGHGYPAGPTMGVPCPTTIYTFGLFLWSIGSVPRHLLAIPVLWAVLAAPAALSWGVVEDAMMPVAALLVIAFAMSQRRMHRGPMVSVRAHR